MTEDLKQTPDNLRIVWNRGSKSYVENSQYKNKSLKWKHILFWKEAPRGEQLSEGTYEGALQTIIGLANTNPKDLFQYTRQDLDSMPETENNRPYKLGEKFKVINIFNRIFRG